MDKKIKIGIDIDRTMNSVYYDGYLQGLIFCKQNNHEYTFDNSKLFTSDQFQLTKKLTTKFIDIYYPLSCRYSQLLPECGPIIRYLDRSDNIELYCITSRSDKNIRAYNYNPDIMIADTMEWFNVNALPFGIDNTYFGVYNKGKKCKDLGIDIMIDDSPKQIKHCIDNGITVCYPVYPYNKHIESSDKVIPLQYGWIDFLKYINSLTDI